MIDKKIAILGSSGSIGTQALDVCRLHKIPVEAISVNTDIEKAQEQIREFAPAFCAVTDEGAAKDLRSRVADTGTQIFGGTDGLFEMITRLKSDTVLNSIIGGAGLLPTVLCVKEGKNIALANKETLVCAGDYIMSEVRRISGERIKIGPGTLYTMLDKFYSAYLIKRTNLSLTTKSYIITDEGKKILKEEYARLSTLILDGKEIMEGLE